MAYCGPLALSHSHFLGGPAVWTDQDREKALAWQVLQRSTCRSCGTRPDEWDPSKGGDVRAYTADLTRCLGCIQVERMQHTAQTSPEFKGERGIHVVLKRNQ